MSTKIKVKLTLLFKNKKTGEIPVSITDKQSCPSTCPMKGAGCYAEGGNTRLHWNAMANSTNWEDFCAKIAALPTATLWRHNEVGDLPHKKGEIDVDAMALLAKANTGRCGFTYTHHKVNKTSHAFNAEIVRQCNARGFTINLSADSLQEVDEKVALGIGPVVCALPSDAPLRQRTKAGNIVIQCPAVYRNNIQCKNCGLCAVATRKAVIGFPAHGTRKRMVNERLALVAS